MSNRYAPEIRRLFTQFHEESVEFWMVYAGPCGNLASIEKHIAGFGFPGKPIRDPHHELVKRANVSTAPEAAVFDSEGKLMYHGRIDDLWVAVGTSRPMARVHDLEDAIAAVLEGRTVKQPESRDRMQPRRRQMNRWLLLLGLPAFAQTPDFAHNIAPIVYQKCAPCHRPGESGPFSLITYNDVKKHALQIADVTRRRFMPPWLPEPGYGDFQDNLRLTDAQIKTIGDWANAGAPEGPPSEIPAPPHFTEGWQLGPPT